MSQSDKHAISIFVVRRIVSLDNHSVTGNLYKKCVPSYGQRMLTMWFYNYHSRYRQVLFEELVWIVKSTLNIDNEIEFVLKYLDG